MDGYGKLIVGCVILIPLIALALLASWKNWHGRWLALADFTYIPGEGSESLHRRKGKRAALFNLVLVSVLVGMLGSSTLSAVEGLPVNAELWTSTMIVVLAGGTLWIGAASRRDAQAVARTSATGAPGHAEEYRLDARHVVVLAIVVIAIPIVEIGSSFIA